jgi:hypothetical protein
VIQQEDDADGDKIRPRVDTRRLPALFRFGLGGYAGYRLGSKTKYVFTDEGSKRKLKDRDNYHLNNWRYGLRMQIGYRGIDLFANYDLNELFISNRGPALNAFSFGVIL